MHRKIHSGPDDNLEKSSSPSMGPIPIYRLKNLINVDKWSSVSLCLSVWGLFVAREFGLYNCEVKMGQIAFIQHLQ